MKRLLLLALPLLAAACGCEETPPPPSPSAPAADRAVDLVCNMRVDKSTPHRVDHQGTTYYFCAEACLKKFQAAPESFIPKARKP